MLPTPAVPTVPFAAIDAPILRDYAERWLARRERALAPRTTATYRDVLDRYVLPHIGDLSLVAITGRLLTDLFDVMAAQRRAPATIRLAVFAVTALLRDATEAEVLPRNPADRLAARYQAIRKEAPCYTPTQLADFLEEAERSAPSLAPLFAVMGKTGMRIGEARGLQRYDIDVTARTIRIERQIHRDGSHGDMPKGHKRRIVPIVGSLLATAERLAARRDHVWCFPEVTGASGYQIVRRTLHRIARDLGLRPLSPKAFRHTFGSTLIARGESPESVRRMMGHSDLRTTISIYGSHFPMRRSALLDEL